MELGLAGRRAAVAAATNGLGFAVAAALTAEGAHVAICGSDEQRVTRAAERLGTSVIPLVSNLADPDDAEQFVVEARSALGGLDILVANGPGPAPGTFASTPADAYTKALDLSLLSVVRMCLAAVPEMQRQHWGRVVAITSITVRQPIPNLILSNTARAGVTGFLKTLAREVAPDNVTVNSVQPGLHDTDRVLQVYGESLEAEVATIPSRSLGQAADFGQVVAFLCSEQARYVTGVAIPVDGGVNQGLL